jgi:hypothetical protein
MDTVVALGGFSRTPDLAVHVVIGHGVAGEWPRLPAMAIASPEPHHDEK